jgi:hypothetical protein
MPVARSGAKGAPLKFPPDQRINAELVDAITAAYRANDSRFGYRVNIILSPAVACEGLRIAQVSPQTTRLRTFGNFYRHLATCPSLRCQIVGCEIYLSIATALRFDVALNIL